MTIKFTKDELIYLYNCTGAHKYVVRPRDPYPPELDQIYYSVRSKMDYLLDEVRNANN